MFIRNKFNLITRSADAEGSGGDGGGEDTTITTTDGGEGENEVTKLIEQKVAEAIAGLKKKNEEVIGKNKKLADELAAAKAKPTLSDEEYTAYKTLQEKIAHDELLRDLAEGKTEEVIERVTKRTRLDAEAKLAAEAEARAAKEREAGEWKARYEQTLVNVEIAKAAAASTVKPAYAELVTKLVAERVKLVDGAVRVVNADGEIEMTANGAKPLTVSDAIEMLRGSYADLFVASSGGGAGGSAKKNPGNSTKLSMEAAAAMDMETFERARLDGRI